MDYILLLLVKKILHYEARCVRILAGAGVGAFLTCILIILPIPNTFLEIIMFHVIVNTCMIQVGFKTRNLTSFMRAFLLLYIGSFLMGGILNVLSPYGKWGSFVCVFAVLGYHICLAIWNFLSKLHKWDKTHVKVKISLQGENIELDALIDTGNSLYDPATGKPVSIISKEVGKKFLHEDEETRYIFLQTLQPFFFFYKKRTPSADTPAEKVLSCFLAYLVTITCA
jgi:stage II sporulation protein GA (sporulation sigma-E factor processing peptidase)